MVLETVGIGLVVPTMAVLSEGNAATKYPLVAKAFTFFNAQTSEEMATVAMIVLAAIFTVKTAFMALLAWRQSRFAYSVQAALSDRLFIGYLRQPYTFHLQHNSGRLIQVIAGETSIFVQAALGSGLILMTEAFVVVGVSALLVVMEPVGALAIAAILGSAVFTFGWFTRHPVRRWGEQRALHDGSRLMHLQQGLGGAKEVKLMGREQEFAAQYQLHSAASARANARAAAMQALPRLWLELLAVLGLAAVVIIMLARGRALSAIVPLLALFGAAAFRLMPSVNRILAAVQNVRYSRTVVVSLYNEVRGIEAIPPAKRGDRLPFRDELKLEDVSFRYAGTRAPALRSVTLSIPRGSSTGIIGSSGAGKSTIVDIILGLLQPSSGKVLVDGIDIHSNVRGWQDRVGYVPQTIYLTDDTLRRNVAFGLPDADIDEDAIRRAIRAAQLDAFVDEQPEGLETVVGERGVRLSGGQRQRIGIARALYHDPDVLVLDEATSALDSATEKGIIESVRALQGEKTVIVIAHRLSTVAYCDRLYRVERGRLVDEGETQAVLQNVQTAS